MFLPESASLLMIDSTVTAVLEPVSLRPKYPSGIVASRLQGKHRFGCPPGATPEDSTANVNFGIEELAVFCGPGRSHCTRCHVSVVVDVTTRVYRISRCSLIHVKEKSYENTSDTIVAAKRQTYMIESMLPDPVPYHRIRSNHPLRVLTAHPMGFTTILSLPRCRH